MRIKVCLATFVVVLALIPCFAEDSQGALPVHSKSKDALRLYREGVELRGNLRTDEALSKFKSAVKADPDFAMAWTMIAISETSPAATARAREKARQLQSNASEGEQMMIQWVLARGGSNMIAAIAAANDLVSKYSGDKFVLYEVGAWYGTALSQWERVGVLQEQALAVDPNYPPALNEAGYAYAYQHRFDKAIAAMKRYTELVPKEPNPQDSYAEILRLSGRYGEALTHYREALKILPTFSSSQQGLGDTYALMGDQERARAEYARCSSGKLEAAFTITCRQMAAYTYVREKNFDAATKQLETFIAAMQKEDQTGFAVDAILAEAFIAKDVPSAFASFDRAIEAIAGDHNMPRSEKDERLARIMAHKARVAALAGDTARAQRSIAELESFKQSADPLIQAAWNGGNGAWLYSQKKYKEAISELQDDSGNPFSQLMLFKAYQGAGNDQAAADLKDSVLTQHSLEIDLWLAQQALKS